jgi:hypothetical protein
MGPDGVVTEMKLSEFMVQYGVDMTPPTTDKKTTDKVPKKISKSSKFTVHKGGKNDSEGTSH